MSQAVERYHHRGDVEVARAVALFRNSPRLVAGAFAPKDGPIDWGAVELACATALDWNLSPLANAHLMPVINNRVYPMAEVCRTLAARAGWNIDIVEDTPESCTGVIYRGDRRPPALTITLAEAKKMGSAATNDNYTKDPRAMLRAKVSRRLVLLYCPEVLAGTPPDRVAWEEDSGPAPVGEVRPGPETRGDGSTVPEHLRQPECPDELRQALIARLAILEAAMPDRVRALAAEIAPARIPNLRRGGPDFKLAHGWLLDRLFADLEADLGPAPAVPSPGDPPPAGDAREPVPSNVYDDDPQSRNYEPDDEDYGRPFGDDA